MTTQQWDAEFLEERERDAWRALQRAQFDADWQQAIAQAKRETSDAVGGFRLCPLHACRRAHRCGGDDPSCVKRTGRGLHAGAEHALIEDIYAEIQEARREAAEQGEAVEANAC